MVCQIEDESLGFDLDNVMYFNQWLKKLGTEASEEAFEENIPLLWFWYWRKFANQ